MDVALSHFFYTAQNLARAANLPFHWSLDLLHFVISSRMKVVQRFIPQELSEHF